jgi:hypothetical protein
MPDRKRFGSIREAEKLLEKARSVIERFGSDDPAIAPPSLCRIYSLLYYLNENNIHIHTDERQLEDLKTELRKCMGLLERHDPSEEGSLLFTWPTGTEVELNSLLDIIDNKLVQLGYHAPSAGKASTP